MENEIMNVDEMEVLEGEIMGDGCTGMSTGGAIILGAALVVATAAVIKLGKKAWGKYKAHKELRQHDPEVPSADEDIEEVTK